MVCIFILAWQCHQFCIPVEPSTLVNIFSIMLRLLMCYQSATTNSFSRFVKLPLWIKEDGILTNGGCGNNEKHCPVYSFWGKVKYALISRYVLKPLLRESWLNTGVVSASNTQLDLLARWSSNLAGSSFYRSDRGLAQVVKHANNHLVYIYEKRSSYCYTLYTVHISVRKLSCLVINVI